MNATLPNIRVGDPLRHEQLAVFPLFAEELAPVDYVLAADAIAAGSVVVEEVSEQGSVPDLAVENTSDTLVLFLEGEQLIGAKQNRILNTSILIAAKSKTRIPVSCVEQGRWRYMSKHFGASDSYSPTKLRHSLKSSVSASLKMSRGAVADQGEVWRDVADYEVRHGSVSRTSSLQDTFDTHRDKLAELRKRFGYIEGATGIAVAFGEQIVAVDLYDKPATCRKTWDRLLSPVLLDSAVALPTEKRLESHDVQRFLDGLKAAPWQAVAVTGEGEEVRAATDRGIQASVLSFTGNLVHGSAVAPVDCLVRGEPLP